MAETYGIPPERLTQEMADAMARAILTAEADDVAHAAVEKILRRIAAGAPGHEAKTAEMIRAYILDGAIHIAALDEAKTGRRRQRENSKRPRPDGLQSIIIEIMEKNPAITQAGLLAKLRLYPTGEGEILDDINDQDDTIDWHDKNHPAASTRFSALKDRMSRARKKIASR